MRTTSAKYVTKEEIDEAINSDFKELEKILLDSYPKTERITEDSDVSYFITGIEETYATSCLYKNHK